MVQASEIDTALIQKSIGSTSRVGKNAIALKVLDAESRGATLEELLPFISGQRSAKVFNEGELDAGVFSCGQSVARIREIQTVKEIISEVVGEGRHATERMRKIWSDTNRLETTQ
jgi:NADH:quinone reductase (non-electrogenic)